MTVGGQNLLSKPLQGMGGVGGATGGSMYYALQTVSQPYEVDGDHVRCSPRCSCLRCENSHEILASTV